MCLLSFQSHFKLIQYQKVIQTLILTITFQNQVKIKDLIIKILIKQKFTNKRLYFMLYFEIFVIELFLAFEFES